MVFGTPPSRSVNDLLTFEGSGKDFKNNLSTQHGSKLLYEFILRRQMWCCSIYHRSITKRTLTEETGIVPFIHPGNHIRSI